MQNADSTVSSPAPSSSHGFKRKRSGSFNNSFLQGIRNPKVPRELVQELQDEDIPMDEVVSSPSAIDNAVRVNGTSSVAGAAAIAAATKALSDSEEWQKTIERIVKSVVAIRFCQVHSFPLSGIITDEQVSPFDTVIPFVFRFDKS
jgi:hypothetical protein